MSSMDVVRFFPPGGPEKLEYRTEERPSTPGPREVVIKVHAAGLIWPELYWPIYQKADGTHTSAIPCRDFAGTISQIGDSITNSELSVGSQVYAFTSRRNHEGALAEFAKADADQILPMPKGLSFVEAASVPLSALTAWQALFDHGKLQRGQTILITGVGGGTGIYAAQLAKHFGARVIGTGSSARSRALAADFDVDEFVDYTTNSIHDVVKDVDLVLDCVGGKAQDEAFQVIKQDGLLISIVEPDVAQLAKKHDLNAMFFIVSMNPSQLEEITKLLERNVIKTVVDKVFPLDRAREAFEEGAQKHVHGKIVVEIAK